MLISSRASDACEGRQVEDRPLCMFVPNVRGGGAERMMVNLANGFSERGERVDFVVACASGPYREEIGEHVEFVDLAVNRIVCSLLPLVRYLRRRNPYVLLVTLNYASIIAIVARWIAGTKTRVVVREASTFSQHRATGIRRRVIVMLVRVLYPYADKVVAVSHGVADDLGRSTGIPRDTITVLPNPVVTKNIDAMGQAPVHHAWLAKDADVPVILAVGSLREAKDYPTLLRAFAEITTVVDARLIILGEGALRSDLQALLVELGIEERVSMPGFVENPFAYMTRASLFVLSSRREGLPGSLIQAMACGCPVISTDCPSGPREILDGGRYGRLLPVGDSESMAKAIIQSLDMPFPDKSCLKQRAAIYSADNSVDQYLRVLLLQKSISDECPDHDLTSV